jgi:excinuclease ABC subunit C
MTASLLDGVPGLGETRRKALLRTFGSVAKLRAASVEEIAAVPGIGPRTAAAVVAALGASEPGTAAAPVPAVNPLTGEILPSPAGPAASAGGPEGAGGFDETGGLEDDALGGPSGVGSRMADDGHRKVTSVGNATSPAAEASVGGTALVGNSREVRDAARAAAAAGGDDGDAKGEHAVTRGNTP